MIRFLFLFVTICSTIFARTLYIMPEDGVEAEKALVKIISESKKEIVATIYTFTNNSLAKAFKKAAKNGVKITIVVDKKNLDSNFKYAKAPELAKLKNITVKTSTGEMAKNEKYYGIMHLKVLIVDNETVVYGSANWSNSAFNINYEILTIEKNREFAKELLGRLDLIIKNAKDY